MYDIYSKVLEFLCVPKGGNDKKSLSFSQMTDPDYYSIHRKDVRANLISSMENN